MRNERSATPHVSKEATRPPGMPAGVKQGLSGTGGAGDGLFQSLTDLMPSLLICAIANVITPGWGLGDDGPALHTLAEHCTITQK
jgi:hypothetical protein